MKSYYVEQSQPHISKNGIMICNIYNHEDEQPSYCAPHIHLDVEIMYVLIGSFAVEIDGTEYIAEKGECLLFRSNAVHSIRALSSGVSYYRVLKVGLPLILSLASTDNSETYIHRFSVGSKGERVKWSKSECEAKGFYEAFLRLNKEYESTEHGADISTKIYVAYILKELLRDIQSADVDKVSDKNLVKTVNDAIYYMHRHYPENITLEQCSKWASLSSSYFSRSFKKITGRSFKDYLNIIRVDAAEKMLMSSDKSVTDIAFECGYNDVSYFALCYRKIKGIKPSDFKKAKKIKG